MTFIKEDGGRTRVELHEGVTIFIRQYEMVDVPTLAEKIRPRISEAFSRHHGEISIAEAVRMAYDVASTALME